MSREFIWIDESYDQFEYEEGKYYFIGAVKTTVEDVQVVNDISKSGKVKGLIPLGIIKSYSNTMKKIKVANGGRTEKKRIHISELHETEIYSNSKSRIVKNWFLNEVITNNNIEIYYVYCNKDNIAIENELKLYKLMIKKLLSIARASQSSEIIMDLCIDQHGNINEEQEIINYLKRTFNIEEPNQIKFMESHANYGLQIVDNIIGTIRRHIHRDKYDKKNYELIQDLIHNFIELTYMDLN
jgi:hypothetical protein